MLFRVMNVGQQKMTSCADSPFKALLNLLFAADIPDLEATWPTVAA